jgi:hypothetical protein
MLRAVLEKIGVADKKVLILTDGSKPVVHMSARNLPNVHTLPFADASTYHILWSDVVLIESAALGAELTPMKESAADLKPKRKRVAREGVRKAREARDETATAAKPKKKAGAKKAPARKATAKAPAAKKAAARKTAARKTTAKKSAPKKKGK